MVVGYRVHADLLQIPGPFLLLQTGFPLGCFGRQKGRKGMRGWVLGRNEGIRFPALPVPALPALFAFWLQLNDGSLEGFNLASPLCPLETS